MPFVQALARRLAASMPHSIDIGDLVQDGMIGLIDAANRFDEERGIKFETFAERRVRGSMIDALRKDAWPRGIRRVRRELEAAREHLRHELGSEPSLADLANHMGADEARLSRTIVRINTIESTSPLASVENVDEASLPPVLVPSEPPAPDKACEAGEVQRRVRVGDHRAASPRDAEVIIGIYYFGEDHDEEDRRGDRRQRVSGFAASRSCRSAACASYLGPDLAPEQLTSLHSQRSRVAQDGQGQGRRSAAGETCHREGPSPDSAGWGRRWPDDEMPATGTRSPGYPATSAATLRRSPNRNGLASH